MDSISDGQYHFELNAAIDKIQHLQTTLKDKDQLLNQKENTINQLNQQFTQLTQEIKELQINNAQLLKEMKENTKMVEFQKDDMKKLQKYQNQQQKNRLRELEQKIQFLNEQMKDLYSKSLQLSKQLENKTKQSQINMIRYQDQLLKNDALQKIILQVQQQTNVAKNFQDKTFQQQYSKVLKQLQRLQSKYKLSQQQNINLKQSINQLSQQLNLKSQQLNQLSQQLHYQHQKSKIPIIPINTCNIQLHYQLSHKIQYQQRQLFDFAKKQETWNHDKIQLQNIVRSRQTDCNNLHNQLYTQQAALTNLQLQKSDLTKRLDDANKKIYQQTQTINFLFQQQTPQPQPQYIQQPQHIQQSQANQQSQLIQPNKPIILDIYSHSQIQTLTPSEDPVEYARKIATSLNLLIEDVYVDIQGTYSLNHSNVPINIDEFLRYDWSKLRQVNFFNTKFDVFKWRTMVENANKFPNLETIYLYGNTITIVKQGDLQEFKKLQMVYFYYTDQTRGYKGTNPLNESSKQYLTKYNSNQSKKSQIFF